MVFNFFVALWSASLQFSDFQNRTTSLTVSCSLSLIARLALGHDSPFDIGAVLMLLRPALIG